MTAGMTILVASFDTTMRGWVERTFQADLYISSSGAQSASTENRISPETWKSMLAHPAVADVNLVQTCEVQLPGREDDAVRRGTGGDAAADGLPWMQPPAFR